MTSPHVDQGHWIRAEHSRLFWASCASVCLSFHVLAIIHTFSLQAISMMQSKSSPATITHSAPMDIFHYLAHELDSEGNAPCPSLS